MSRNTLENASGGSVPGKDATRGDARNANAKRRGRPTGRSAPNARRIVQNAGKSEPWPHR